MGPAREAVGQATRRLVHRTLDLAEQTGLLPTEALVGLGLTELARRVGAVPAPQSEVGKGLA